MPRGGKGLRQLNIYNGSGSSTSNNGTLIIPSFALKLLSLYWIENDFYVTKIRLCVFSFISFCSIFSSTFCISYKICYMLHTFNVR